MPCIDEQARETECAEVPMQNTGGVDGQWRVSAVRSVLPLHAETQEKVEVRPGKYLAPISVGDLWTKAKAQLSHEIIIRVDLEVNNDLERLGDYLGE